MKFAPIFPIVTAALFMASLSALAGSDKLEEQVLTIRSTRSAEVLKRVADDPKAIFQRFQPGLDGSSSIVKPVTVTGTAQRPVMQVSIRKCVAFICKTVDLDATVDVREVRGECDLNFHLFADLSRSSAIVSDMYDSLEVGICYRGQPDGTGKLMLSPSVRHGAKYDTGIVQREMFKFLKLQVPPIVKAIQETLKAKE